MKCDQPNCRISGCLDAQPLHAHLLLSGRHFTPPQKEGSKRRISLACVICRPAMRKLNARLGNDKKAWTRIALQLREM